MTVRSVTQNVPTAHRLAVVIQQLSHIVVGKEAEEVARFVAKYAGEEAETTPRPGEEASP